MRTRIVLTYISLSVIILPVFENVVMSMQFRDRVAYYICLFIVLVKVSVKLNERRF